MEIVFKTSVRIRYVLWLLYALLLGIGVFLDQRKNLRDFLF